MQRLTEPPGASRTGEAWNGYLQGDQLTWCVPEDIGADYFPRHARSEWITRILRHTDLRPSPEVRVLEAGCGTGMFGLSFAVLGCTVEAFDYNARALDFVQLLEARARQTSPDLRFHARQGNLLAIDEPDNGYDLVFNQAVLEYFTVDAERAQALSEMVRVTRPGGWVAVIDQHSGHPLRQRWERLGWPGYTHQPPLIRVTPAGLAAELHAAGLVDVQTDGIYPWKTLFFWPNWHQRWRWSNELVYLIGRALNRGVPLPLAVRRRFGIQVLAVGRKPV